jgi:peptidylprolyl isomerase
VLREGRILLGSEEMKVALTADGQVGKTVLKEGAGTTPSDGQEVTVEYRVKLATGQEVDASTTRSAPFKFLLGGNEVATGLELGVRTMKKGEKALLELGPGYGFGERGSSRIPPNAALQVELELLDFENKKKFITDMTVEEKHKAGEDAKLHGNDHFKAKRLKEAVEAYKVGLSYLDTILDTDQSPAMSSLWTSLSLNLCVCWNGLGRWAECKKQVDKVLDRTPNRNHPKARYLRGIAERNLGHFAEALADLTFALETDPTDARIAVELETTREKQKQAREHEKKAFGQLFQGPTMYDVKTSAVQKVPPYEPKNPHVFFDLRVGPSGPVKTIAIELFSALLPKTVENFRCLCTGEKSTTTQKLAYKGSRFHRLIKGFMLQGGDFDHGDGTGGASIYGPQFPDEPFWLDHDRAGLLSMANKGPNTSGSQFFITFNAADWLNKRHMVFGRVVQGMSVVRELENLPVGANDVPKDEIVIVDCGMRTTPVENPEVA